MKKTEKSKIEKGIKPEVRKEEIKGEKIILEKEIKPRAPEEEYEEVREELKKEFEKEEEKKLEKERKEKIEVIKETVELPEDHKGLIGNDSDEAWARRETMPNSIVAAKSLAGVASKRSRQWIDQNKENKELWSGIAEGLVGDDTEDGWKIRDWLEIDPEKKRLRGERWTKLKKIFGFHRSEFFNKLKKIINFWFGLLYEIGDLIISTTGLKSRRAWQLRKKYENLAPAEVLSSLAGVKSKEADELRKKYERDAKLRWAHKKSLIGTESEKDEKS
jgi:hypothetical protein